MKRWSLAVPEPSTLVSDLRRHHALGQNLRKLATCIVDLGVQPSLEKVCLQGKLELPLAKVLGCIFADKLLLNCSRLLLCSLPADGSSELFESDTSSSRDVGGPGNGGCWRWG